MAIGSRVFFDMMHQPPFKVIVLGDLCSRVTVPVAESAVWWSITQVRDAAAAHYALSSQRISLQSVMQCSGKGEYGTDRMQNYCLVLGRIAALLLRTE